MNPEEMARYRVLSEQLRRTRRENDRLKVENAALLAEIQSLRQGRSAEDTSSNAFPGAQSGEGKIKRKEHPYE